MVKRYVIVGAFLFGCFLIAITPPEQISFGVLYIENRTDWDMKISAKVKDEWEVITPTDWTIFAHGAEKIDNISKLSDIHFHPDIEDDASTPTWLKRVHLLELIPHEQAKDLIVTIAKDPYGDKWNLNQQYVLAAKIEPGGVTGYHVRAISR